MFMEFHEFWSIGGSLLKLQERWWLQHVVEEAALSVEYLSPACE